MMDAFRDSNRRGCDTIVLLCACFIFSWSVLHLYQTAIAVEAMELRLEYHN